MFKFYLLFFFVGIATTSHAQSDSQSPFFTSETYDSALKKSDYVIIKHDDQSDDYRIFSNEDWSGTSRNLAVIVAFQDAPVAINTAGSRLSYEDIFSKFKRDINAFHNSTNARSTSSAPIINRKYFKTFNGVSASIPYQLISKIEALPYVKQVYPDRQVKAFLDKSAQQVNAIAFREKYKTQGKGIVVGIIDTGIDYTHADLGGGYGPKYKVIGGYDFVNNDEDPMDDNGHGTHVSGIVAAQGSMPGIAPAASLVALKVLNNGGYGSHSAIIAAIEWCVDPNGDGDFSDRLDVINLSLGSANGHADDPVSQAVDNAVNAGITVCVAAGNDYDHYKIGSPGTARLAITVGATNQEDKITDFSSKGPTKQNLLLKPDLVAPGFQILAPKPNNTYARHNGTSMATPHVTGAVALLKSIHPDWTPRQLKSALMQGAQPLGLSLWEQGAGRLDIVQAAAQNLLVSPTSLSLGMVDNETDVWVKTDTLTLYNVSDSVKNISLSVEGISVPGLSFSFSTTDLAIAPYDSSRVLFSVIADNQHLPFKPEGIPSYDGHILVNDHQEHLRIGFALFKSPVMALHFDARPDLVVVHDRQKAVFKEHNLDTLVNLRIPQGTYDIMVFFDGFTKSIIRENVMLSSNSSLHISKREAIHELILKGVSPEGEEVSVIDATFEGLRYKGSDLGLRLARFIFYAGKLPKSTKRYVSDISNKYYYELGLTSYPSMNAGHHWLDFPFSFVEGIYASKTCQNSPQDFEKVVFNYRNSFNHTDSLFYTLGKISMSHGSSYKIYDRNMPNANVIKPPYRIEAYYLRNPSPYFNINNIKYRDIYVLDSAEFREQKDIKVATSGRMELNYGTEDIAFTARNALTLLPTKPYAEVTMGMSPPNWSNSIYKNANNLIAYPESVFFSHPFGDILLDSIPYQFSSTDGMLKKGWFVNNSDAVYNDENKIIIPASAGQVIDFTAAYDQFLVNGRRGLATIKNKFFFSFGDFSTNLSNLYFSQNGIPTDMFLPSGLITVTCQPTGGNSAIWSLSMKHTDLDTAWTEVPATYNPVTYRLEGSIQPDTLKPGYYSFRVASSGNYFEYTIEPAFYLATPAFSDSLALAALYHSTKGEKWKNQKGWLADKNLSNWYGVTVKNGRVTAVQLPDNNLHGYLPREIAQMDRLQILDLSGNQLTDLIDLSDLSALEQMNVSANNLSFEDLEPNIDIKNIQYNPQDSLNSTKRLDMNVGNPLELAAFAGGHFNKYTWYKNGKPLENRGDTLRFEALTLQDAGTYHFHVINDTVSNLTLWSRPIQLTVTEDPFQPIRDWIVTYDNGNSRGVNWIDYDSDGDTDLFVLDYNGAHSLYRNELSANDSVSFVKTSFENRGSNNAYSSTWADYDNDGLWDVFITSRELEQPSRLYRNTGNSAFVPVTGLAYEHNRWATNSASWGDYNHDGFADLLLANSYHYLGNSSDDYVLKNEEGKNLLPFQASYGNGTVYCNWTDYDNDGDLDAYFASTYNQLNTNDKDSIDKYKSVNISSKSASISGGSWGDYDNDGDLDLFVANTTPWCVGCEGRNQLYRNDNATFILVNNLPWSETDNNSVGSSWGDYDNDGDLDLFVTNWGEQSELWKNTLIETGTIQFEQAISSATTGTAQSTGVAWGDYDNDGDLDLFVANSFQDNFLFQNKGNANHWLSIACEGTFSNRAAMGTRVQVMAHIHGNEVWQTREISGQTGKSSQNSATLLFGLGNASAADSIIVQWSSGIVQHFGPAKARQHLLFREPDLFLSRPNDAIMLENQTLTIPMRIQYRGDQALVLSASSTNAALSFSFSGTVLKVKAENYTGKALVTVKVEDGEQAAEQQFKLTVKSFEQQTPGEQPGNPEGPTTNPGEPALTPGEQPGNPQSPENPGTITGIDEEQEPAAPVVIYPNPNQGTLYVLTNSKQINRINSIRLISPIGKVVVENILAAGTAGKPLEIDLSHLPAGIYTLQVETDDTIFNRKVVLRK